MLINLHMSFNPFKPTPTSSRWNALKTNNEQDIVNIKSDFDTKSKFKFKMNMVDNDRDSNNGDTNKGNIFKYKKENIRGNIRENTQENTQENQFLNRGNRGTYNNMSTYRENDNTRDIKRGMFTTFTDNYTTESENINKEQVEPDIDNVEDFPSLG